MYKVEVTHNQDMAFNVKAGESEFEVDAKGKGLTPPGCAFSRIRQLYRRLYP
ncbi:MAG: hypothetical protein PHR73_06610 [Candidatus Omnitrophica bacterium]|nr:hypothetical protein [Candidatus Omnitrophota bacterium]